MWNILFLAAAQNDCFAAVFTKLCVCPYFLTDSAVRYFLQIVRAFKESQAATTPCATAVATSSAAEAEGSDGVASSSSSSSALGRAVAGGEESSRLWRLNEPTNALTAGMPWVFHSILALTVFASGKVVYILKNLVIMETQSVQFGTVL